jgi:SAM-dependent methyltransferase
MGYTASLHKKPYLNYLTMKCICCLSERVKPNILPLHEFYACLDCGFIFKARKNREDKRQDLANHYQNIDPHENVASCKQSFFISALEHLSSRYQEKKKSILDVGCGYGYFLALAKEKGWHTSGVEIVRTAVEETKARLVVDNIFHGSLREARYPASSFDAITLWDVLFIFEEPFEDLLECYRILKSGGIIGIRLRNVLFQKMVYRYFSPFKNIASRIGLKQPYVFHSYCFSPQSIYMLLSRLGFINIQITISPQTEGDPYGIIKIKGLIKILKCITETISKFIFKMSSKKILIGPSLLIWAEKPKIDTIIH